MLVTWTGPISRDIKENENEASKIHEAKTHFYY